MPSPVLVGEDNRLVATDSWQVAAYDRTTGAIAWSIADPSASLIAATSDGGAVYSTSSGVLKTVDGLGNVVSQLPGVG
ncbi:MAG: hypothetical protein ABR606_02280, partial [Vicinamibacterales bacterium]